ncbi:Probable purple acid phosphatase 20 [Linum perenne]
MGSLVISHHRRVRQQLLLLSILAIYLAGFSVSAAVPYTRPPRSPDIPLRRLLSQDASTPQQVHISMVGADKMRITWITDDPTPATVDYGTSPGNYPNSATGTTHYYEFMSVYKSGQIHDVVVGPLEPDTVYYYRCGVGNSARQLSFKTAPSAFPVKFVIVGDLGQTEHTNSTLQHISESNYDMLLLPGDLSYADSLQPRWDSFGQMMESLASQRPWMVTQGNHELDKSLTIHPTPFIAYNARWQMPFQESGSTSNLYYSFNVAGAHVIMLGSYTDFSPSSAQYKWLQSDLAQVDRSKTPWLLVLVHAPWYSSNKAHQGETESVDMKKYMEGLLYDSRVDAVFAGHVHAYERFTQVYNDKEDDCGPVYITIGDGGNREGLAKKYHKHQPDISIFREASFGHGEFEVVNGTHGLWTWHRNDDGEDVVSDSVWIRSLSSVSDCKV